MFTINSTFEEEEGGGRRGREEKNREWRRKECRRRERKRRKGPVLPVPLQNLTRALSRVAEDNFLLPPYLTYFSNESMPAPKIQNRIHGAE